MPDLTAMDLAALTHHELVDRVLGEQESAAFYYRRYKDTQGRCGELLEEARSARAREREARRIIDEAIDGAGAASGQRAAALAVGVPVVAVSGFAGAGKDEVAKILAAGFGLTVTPLARPLKDLAASVFGFSQRQLYGPSACRNAPDERYTSGHWESWEAAEDALCEHGPAWLDAVGLGRAQFPLLRCWFDDVVTLCAGKWGRKPMEKLTARHVLQTLGTEMARAISPSVWVDHLLAIAAKSPNGVVVPDARFANEVHGIRAAGGRCIRVKRVGAGLEGRAASHASETEMLAIADSDFDAIIENDGTLEDLAVKVRKAVAPFMTEWRRTA